MEYGGIAIIAICALVLVIGTLKQKSKVIFNFFIRGAVGLISVYFCNGFLEMQGFSAAVGLNPMSFLTLGTLGISGFALLYAICVYQIL